MVLLRVIRPATPFEDDSGFRGGSYDNGQLGSRAPGRNAERKKSGHRHHLRTDCEEFPSRRAAGNRSIGHTSGQRPFRAASGPLGAPAQRSVDFGIEFWVFSLVSHRYTSTWSNDTELHAAFHRRNHRLGAARVRFGTEPLFIARTNTDLSDEWQSMEPATARRLRSGRVARDRRAAHVQRFATFSLPRNGSRRSRGIQYAQPRYAAAARAFVFCSRRFASC